MHVVKHNLFTRAKDSHIIIAEGTVYMAKTVKRQRSSSEWKDSEWRALVQATTEAYLAPDFEPRMRLSAARLARRQNIRIERGVASLKAERYALAAAAIYRITEQLITGRGAEAHYRPEVIYQGKTFASDDPFEQLSTVARYTFYEGARAVRRDTSTHLDYFLRRFNHLGERHDHATSGFIAVGGTMPIELKHYTRATARAFQETRATRRLTGTQRTAGAHQMLPVLTHRAAQHIDGFIEGRGWAEVERSHPHIEPLNMTDREMQQKARLGELAVMTIVGPDDEPLFPVMRATAGFLGPLIRCPAHQRLYGTESALQLQLHAGVNLAANAGLYNPQLVIPALL
jgi:hypothetical protein